MNPKKLEALYQDDLEAAACGCGGACRECRQHMEEIENLPGNEYEEFLGYCADRESRVPYADAANADADANQ